MADPDDPASPVATTYTVSVSGKAERLVRALADAFELERPSALGPLGQLADIASEAFARGLVELRCEHGSTSIARTSRPQTTRRAPPGRAPPSRARRRACTRRIIAPR